MTTEYPLVGRHLIHTQKESTVLSIHISDKTFAKITLSPRGIIFECPAKLTQRELRFLSIHNPTINFQTEND